MNRRLFLNKSLLSGAAVVLAPLVALAPINFKRPWQKGHSYGFVVNDLTSWKDTNGRYIMRVKTAPSHPDLYLSYHYRKNSWRVSNKGRGQKAHSQWYEIIPYNKYLIRCSTELKNGELVGCTTWLEFKIV